MISSKPDKMLLYFEDYQILQHNSNCIFYYFINIKNGERVVFGQSNDAKILGKMYFKDICDLEHSNYVLWKITTDGIQKITAPYEEVRFFYEHCLSHFGEQEAVNSVLQQYKRTHHR